MGKGIENTIIIKEKENVLNVQKYYYIKTGNENQPLFNFIPTRSCYSDSGTFIHNPHRFWLYIGLVRVARAFRASLPHWSS